MEQELLRKYIELYGSPMYSGEAELYASPNTVGTALGHTQYLPQGLLNLGGGVDYIPRAEDKLVPYGFAEYQDPSGLNINALMDKYRKTAGAEYGPAYANITQTDNDLIKQLGLQGQNFGANITDSNQGAEFGLNALLNMFGGQASAAAYKNPEDKGFMFSFTKPF